MTSLINHIGIFAYLVVFVLTIAFGLSFGLVIFGLIQSIINV